MNFNLIKKMPLTQASKAFILTALLIATASCVTRRPTDPGIRDVSTTEYESLIEQKTQKSEVYDGFYNKLTFYVTPLDSDVSEAQSAYTAKLLQLSLDNYQKEKAKLIATHSTESVYFLSLYTPERKHNDLNSSQTLWRVYLEVNGKRYDGTVKKLKSQYVELETLYPYHNRWATPYQVSFNIPTALSEKKPAKFILTGPVATSEVEWK